MRSQHPCDLCHSWALLCMPLLTIHVPKLCLLLSAALSSAHWGILEQRLMLESCCKLEPAVAPACRILLHLMPQIIIFVQAAKKAQFEELVRMEFAKVMASGALSANEAAVQAVALARARTENLDVSRLSH